MNGAFEVGDKEYEWWAGSASPDAAKDWCVHCRHGKWGVTSYQEDALEEDGAERVARGLAVHVESLEAL